jgi:ribosome biogenesis GTPase A
LQDEEYVDNAKKFEENFYHKDCFMIEKIDVLPTEETHEWQHYKKEYYNKIAKKVHSITNQEIKKNILVEAA